MSNEMTRVVVYRLGEGYPTTREGEPLYSWPYTVHYAPGCEEGSFFLASGDARNGNGTFLRPEQVLEPQWRGELRVAGAEWLVPLLERMAQGEQVESSEVLAAYQMVHGEPAVREEWTVRR